MEVTNNYCIFAVRIAFPKEVPALYRRTYALALFFGMFATGIFGLFDYDCEFWCWNDRDGFRPWRLTKRVPAPMTATLENG